MTPQLEQRQIKERPILFSGEMVRAILEGRKTQTRRIIKLPRDCSWYHAADPVNDGNFLKHGLEGYWHVEELPCPYGKPGDRLWVREAHAFVPEPAYRCSTGIIQKVNPVDSYQACVYRENFDRARSFSWRPSIHMPRWACRILLEITGVRVERLQDISEEDALAEGVDNSLHLGGGRFATENFAHLWWMINGDGSWESNPWVWCISFRRIES